MVERLDRGAEGTVRQTRLDRWRMETSDLIDLVEEKEVELAAARAEAEAYRTSYSESEHECVQLRASLQEAESANHWLSRDLAAARAQLAEREALLRDSLAHVKDAGHLSAKCSLGECRLNSCGMEDLLQRLAAALGEGQPASGEGLVSGYVAAGEDRLWQGYTAPDPFDDPIR